MEGYNEGSSGEGKTYNFSGNKDELLAFMSGLIQRYQRSEGFVFEANLANGSEEQLVAVDNIGIFKMQKISIKTHVEQDVVLRGSGAIQEMIKRLLVVPAWNSCLDEDVKGQSFDLVKTGDENVAVFKNVKVDHGLFRLCLVLEVDATTSLLSPARGDHAGDLDTELVDFVKSAGTRMNGSGGNNNGHSDTMLDAGILASKGYFLRQTIDLVPSLQNCQGDKRSITQLGVLVNDGIVVLKDCNESLWFADIVVADGIVRVKDEHEKIDLQAIGSDPDETWLFCKEFHENKRAIVVGRLQIVVLQLPIVKSGPKFFSIFTHYLSNPMDVALFEDTIFVSDGYLKSVVAFYPSSNGQKYHYFVAFENVYWVAISIISWKNSHEFIAIDGQGSSILRFSFTKNGHIFAFAKLNGYDPPSDLSNESVEQERIGLLVNPSSMDVYRGSFGGEEVRLLFVAEAKTGRIAIFRLEFDAIVEYKVFYSRGILTRIRVDSSLNLFLSTWRKYLGTVQEFLLYKPVHHYMRLKFHYNTLEKYQGGDEIRLEPIFRASVPELFYSPDVVLATSSGSSPSQGGVEKWYKANLQSIGLTLDKDSGIVSGKISRTGRHYVTIFGSTILKDSQAIIAINASCPQATQFNTRTKTCEACPIGTFRNNEAEDKCIECSSVRVHSTTRDVGSRLASDCLCEPGYFLDDSRCVPCKPGTFKSDVSNSECSGMCRDNLTSQVEGARSEEELGCECMPRFYDLRNVNDPDALVPLATLESIGLSNHQGIVFADLVMLEKYCAPCDVGYYCPGGSRGQIPCGYGRSTLEKYSLMETECACDVGFGYESNGKCKPCSPFGYKDKVGNVPCIQCHAHASRRNIRPMLWPFIPATRRDITTGMPILVARGYASTSVEACRYCISGYYFDHNLKDCLPCPVGSFCPGFDNQPVRCGTSGTTRGTRSTSGIDCLCSAGYGNVLEYRNPISLSVVCHQCPPGHFQHLSNTDVSCLPCPLHSNTLSFGSTSLDACIPEAGYFIKALVDFGSMRMHEMGSKSFEEWRDGNGRDDGRNRGGGGASTECMSAEGMFIKSRFSALIQRESAESCDRECKRNIYCTGYLFNITRHVSQRDATPYATNEVLVFGGMGYTRVEFFMCQLFFFTMEVNGGERGEFKHGNKTGTLGKRGEILCRVPSNHRYMAEPCPQDHYCPGQIRPVPCPLFSKTLGVGAKSLESCLCLPGYEPSSRGGKCDPCKMGWYKPRIGNLACQRCPDRLKTFNPGAKHITECACIPGYFAQIQHGRMDGLKIGSAFQVDVFGNVSMARMGEGGIGTMNEGGIGDVMGDYKPEKNTKSLIFITDPLLIVPEQEANLEAWHGMQTHRLTCERCRQNHYCPGGWVYGFSNRRIHNIPYKCPLGSSVPSRSTHATMASQCLCLPGYRMEVYSQSETRMGEAGARCVKCEGGMYKESHENSPCSGRCMQYATTYGGSVSKSQCFCQYGRYMVIDGMLPIGQDGMEAKLKCVECVKGAICPGGLVLSALQKLRQNAGFDGISIRDHVQPIPKFGYFAVSSRHPPFDGMGVDVDETEYGHEEMEMYSYTKLEIHPCPLEFRCDGRFAGNCSSGSTGYLCSRCLPGHDMVHYRSQCRPCGPVLLYLSRFILYKLPILVLGLVFFFCSTHLPSSNGGYTDNNGMRKDDHGMEDGYRPEDGRRSIRNLFCTLFKMAFELYLAMAPYGMVHLRSPSSLRKFSWYYNAIFGYSTRMFRYLSPACLLGRDFGDLSWHMQRFVNLLQPLVDTLLLLSLVHLFTLLRITKLCNWMGGESLSMRTTSNPWTATPKCLLIMGYIYFSFICQELLQMLWCINVQYKHHEPVLVLLHAPSQVCTGGLLYYFPASLLAILLSLYIFGPVIWVASGHGRPAAKGGLNGQNGESEELMPKQTLDHSGHLKTLLTCGHKKYFGAWDAIYFGRRFITVIITTFQTGIQSSGPAEKLRITASILSSIVMLILHTKYWPFQVRGNNVFNRLELVALVMTITTGFIMQGSFSFDFDHAGLVPIYLFFATVLLFAWTGFSQACNIAGLERGKRNKGWLHKFLLWYNRAQVTFDYRGEKIVLEDPLAKRMRISSGGRSALQTCVYQSVCKLVLEDKCIAIPNLWMEFLVRHGFLYRRSVSSVQSGARAHVEYEWKADLHAGWAQEFKGAPRVVVAGTDHDEVVMSKDEREEEERRMTYDKAPITPWIINHASLETPSKMLIECYKGTCGDGGGKGKRGGFRRLNLERAMDRLEEMQGLEEELREVNQELERRIEMAKIGKRALEQMLGDLWEPKEELDYHCESTTVRSTETGDPPTSETR
ncbi:hypothetical protein BEWA_029890 [Theileria equi strain WA]|uniref:Tyrosine-protein kinase ephrin type A/B receptor-like domain-containing protein n=1 Tax=Theileria equi strain WA TaxID=1537102 RepID=L0AXZ1_THEEQ|nr:hypothetical protein BEWA_029890 [Theileria equi strain WA]AFZ80138.1 hypothetical protein BEWA_029890 [Theileria equi strain WA]|eukprot:XP_004829804.1 hypothetical protein BEWA_029890 [Theileria equi strain WA]